MTINSVDMNRALTSASYAQQLLRSGIITPAQRGELVAKWGAETILKWESVDGNEYVIDDVSYDSARSAGKRTVQDSTGCGNGPGYAGVVDAGIALTGAVGGRILGNKIFTNVGNKFSENLGKKAEEKFIAKTGDIDSAKNVKDRIADGKSGQKSVSDIVAVTIASGEVAKYLVQEPNKAPHSAIMQIYGSELPQGQEALYQTQADMADTSAEVLDLVDEADTTNQDANDKIEEDYVKFEFYRNEYLSLKDKANSGVKLTKEEKAVMKELAPLMEDLGECIVETQEETQGEVEEIYGMINDKQDSYDESAETIAEVQGMTDAAEEVDEPTRTQCYFEAAAKSITSVSAGSAAARLYAKASAPGMWGLYIPAAIGAAASVASGKFAVDQNNMAGEITEEIGARRDLQDFTSETYSVYEDELDNYAGNIEVVEDLELEMPEDMEVPEDNPTQTGDSDEKETNPLAAAASGAPSDDDEDDNNNFGNGKNDKDNEVDLNKNKKK